MEMLLIGYAVGIATMTAGTLLGVRVLVWMVRAIEGERGDSRTPIEKMADELSRQSVRAATEKRKGFMTEEESTARVAKIREEIEQEYRLKHLKGERNAP